MLESGGPGETLSRRAPNRAALARQLLLERSAMPVHAALEHLVWLQAQTPQTWSVGMWSRLARFDPERLSAMVADRRVVRIAVMQTTIHPLGARDEREGGSKEMATTAIRPLVGLSAAARRELEAEGIALLAFAAADASGHAVRFEPVGGGR